MWEKLFMFHLMGRMNRCFFAVTHTEWTSNILISHTPLVYFHTYVWESMYRWTWLLVFVHEASCKKLKYKAFDELKVLDRTCSAWSGGRQPPNWRSNIFVGMIPASDVCQHLSLSNITYPWQKYICLPKWMWNGVCVLFCFVHLFLFPLIILWYSCWEKFESVKRYTMTLN